MLNRFRPTSATAIAAAIGCALIASAAAPAFAKEKPKKEEEAKKGTSIPASKDFGPYIKKMSDAVKASDAATLQNVMAEAQGKATADGDRYWLSYYKLQLGLLNKDRATQQQAIDAMLESGLTPAESVAVYNFFSGRFAYVDKDYAKAITRLEAAQAAGSKDESLSPMLMDSYLNTNQLDRGIALAKATIESERAAGKRPSEELYVRPARALQVANRNGEMLDLLALRLRDYNLPAVWRTTLYIVMQQEGSDKDLNLDTLRLMRAAHAMKERPEVLEYAALATEAGYPGEVVALVKEARASGIVPANDERFNSIMESQEPRARADAAVLAADAAKPAVRSNPKAARQTADALAGSGDYATAISLYQGAAAGGDALAQYRLGVAQALDGQVDAAVASFAKVQGNRQRLAQLWTIFLTAKPSAAVAPAAPAAGS